MLCHPLRKSFQFWIQSTNQSSGHDGINLTAWKAFIAGSRDWKLKVMKVMTAMKAMKAYLKPIWSLFEGNEGNEGLSRQWRPWRPWRPWEREIPGIFRFSPGSWIVHLISTSSQKDPKHVIMLPHFDRLCDFVKPIHKPRLCQLLTPVRRLGKNGESAYPLWISEKHRRTTFEPCASLWQYPFWTI